MIIIITIIEYLHFYFNFIVEELRVTVIIFIIVIIIQLIVVIIITVIKITINQQFQFKLNFALIIVATIIVLSQQSFRKFILAIITFVMVMKYFVMKKNFNRFVFIFIFIRIIQFTFIIALIIKAIVGYFKANSDLFKLHQYYWKQVIKLVNLFKIIINIIILINFVVFVVIE